MQRPQGGLLQQSMCLGVRFTPLLPFCTLCTFFHFSGLIPICVGLSPQSSLLKAGQSQLTKIDVVLLAKAKQQFIKQQFIKTTLASQKHSSHHLGLGVFCTVTQTFSCYYFDHSNRLAGDVQSGQAFTQLF